MLHVLNLTRCIKKDWRMRSHQFLLEEWSKEHEPRAQNQPDAIERLTTLMSLYMEFQMARPVRCMTLHEQFMKLNPPEFVGATDPLVAEE